MPATAAAVVPMLPTPARRPHDAEPTDLTALEPPDSWRRIREDLAKLRGGPQIASAVSVPSRPTN